MHCVMRSLCGMCSPITNNRGVQKRRPRVDLELCFLVQKSLLGAALLVTMFAIRNKKLLGTSASLVVTGALLVVTRSY